MSQLDPHSPEVRKAVAEAVDDQRASIIRKIARSLEDEGKRRHQHGDTTTWDDAVEYLRVLALGEVVTDDNLT